MPNYFTLLTKAGLVAVTNAQLTNNKVEITQVAVGDANGTPYQPTGTELTLRREVWRGGVSSVEIDAQNPNWIVIEGVIPATAGGFSIREVGLYDANGTLIAIGNYPDTYKPLLSDGSTMDLALRTIIEVNNASSVTLRVDPNIIVASRKYVDDQLLGINMQVTKNTAKIADRLIVSVDYAHLVVNNDWTNAINTALLDAFNGNIREVLLPFGMLNHTGIQLQRNVALLGYGIRHTFLNNTSNNDSITGFGAGNQYFSYWALKGVTITTTTKNTQKGINLYIAADYTLDDVNVINHRHGIYNKGSWRQSARNVTCRYNDYGWYYAYNDIGFISASPLNHVDCYALDNTEYGVFMDGHVDQFSWSGGDITRNGIGIYGERNNVKSLGFYNINFEANGTPVVLGKSGGTDTPASISFYNCRFFNPSVATENAVVLNRAIQVGFYSCQFTRFTNALYAATGSSFDVVAINSNTSNVTNFANLIGVLTAPTPRYFARNSAAVRAVEIRDTSMQVSRLRVGTSDKGISKLQVFNKTVNISGGLIPARSTYDATIVLDGTTETSTVNDSVVVSGYSPNGTMLTGYASSTANTIMIRIANVTNDAVNVPSVTAKVEIKSLY